MRRQHVVFDQQATVHCPERGFDIDVERCPRCQHFAGMSAERGRRIVDCRQPSLFVRPLALGMRVATPVVDY